MKHRNPYAITNPDDIFEVSENSSHPELKDAKRIWRLGGYVFHSSTELHKFFTDEGLNPRNYVIEPVIQSDMGKNKITVNVVEKHNSRMHQRMRGFE